MCVCVSECVLSTVTAGGAAVAGRLSCRVGPCVGYYLTGQLKYKIRGKLVPLSLAASFCLFSHTLVSLLAYIAIYLMFSV